MPVKLRPEETVTIQVLHSKGVPNTEIARQLDVSEGTVRYHVRRQAAGAIDGRRQKLFKAAKHRAVIDHWFQVVDGVAGPEARGVNVGVISVCR